MGSHRIAPWIDDGNMLYTHRAVRIMRQPTFPPFAIVTDAEHECAPRVPHPEKQDRLGLSLNNDDKEVINV